MSWLLTLLAWFGLGASGLEAKPPPPLTCRTITDRAILFMERGVLNCADGPLFLDGSPSSLSLDDVTISSTSDGKLVFSHLTGAGRVQACLDERGALYRGNPNC